MRPAATTRLLADAANGCRGDTRSGLLEFRQHNNLRETTQTPLRRKRMAQTGKPRTRGCGTNSADEPAVHNTCHL